MSVNSTSSSSDSLLHPNISSIHCHMTRPGSAVITSYNITNILLLLPLSIFILHLGLQRWRQQRSNSAAAMASHSDSFTYHMVAMELIGVIGHTLCCCGVYTDQADIYAVGFYLWSFTWYGEMFFHILTCAEHYLAVVHPITYRSLRSERGLRIRNISIGCVWVLAAGMVGLWTSGNDILVFDLCLYMFCLIITCFCSLSVLRILIRPGPGEQGGERERVDQSKQKAFYTIFAILVVLLLRFAGNLLLTSFDISNGDPACVTVVFETWFNLPSSLVLPLLFLQRAGTFACFEKFIK